ncbi:MAG: DUF1059 domain-containing protein [Acidimicrobiales bacterium]
MTYVIRCDCGTDMEGSSETEVLDLGVVHAKEEHALVVTPDQLRSFVEEVSN